MPSVRQLIALTLLVFAAGLQAQEVGDTVNLRGTIPDDAYAAGGTVFSSAQIEGDLVASGGTLLMDGKVGSDALLLGGTINLGGAIGDDLRAMGGTVIINSAIGGDLAVAGGQLSLGSRATVQGRAMMAGGTIRVAGTIMRGLQAAGGRIVISGHVHGDVDLEGDRIEILKGAQIDGKLSYRSPQEATIDPGAQIQGIISYQPREWQQGEGPSNWFFIITLAIAAVVFYLLFPGYSVGSLEVMRTEFWKSLGFGVVVLVVIPFVAIVSMVIVAGLWLGLSLLALYFVALLIGSILGMTLAGDQLAHWLRWEPKTRGRRVVTILAAFLLLGLVQMIPILGGLLTFLILLLGLGAGTIGLFRRYIASNTAEVV